MTTFSMMPPNNLQLPPNNNKRKRESSDMLDGSRSRKSQNTNGDPSNDNDDELHLQLLRGLGQEALQEQDDANTRTARAALSAPMQQNTYPPPENSYSSASGLPHDLSSFVNEDPNSPSTGFSAIPSTAQALMAARDATTPNHNKPAVGTQQWHQQRKDNHKEGEPRKHIPVDATEGLTRTQSSDVAAKPSMKASTSLQRSSQVPTKTKAQFYNPPWDTLPNS